MKSKHIYSDDEFCDILGLESQLERELAVKIRELTSVKCRIQKESISAETQTKTLNNSAWTPFDGLDIILPLEEHYKVDLDIELPPFVGGRFFCFYKAEGPGNYGEWVKASIKIISATIQKEQEK